MHAASTLGFTFDELSEIALNGFASAFIPWEDRERLIWEAKAEIARLRGDRRP
jgi:adenosine deaminase